MKRKIILFLIVLIIWQMTSLMIQKEVILPYPSDVFMRMLNDLFQKDFYVAVFHTIVRIFISFFVAMIIGVFLGIVTGISNRLRQYIQPVMTFCQTIPQIGYILILLVWFDSTTALLLIVFFMLVPIFYFNALQGILHIDSDLQDIIQLYHHSFLYNLRYVYIPLIQGYIQSAIQTTLPMSFKAGVMAEIFVSTQYGIGKKLYFARVQIDMTGIFSWILWMVVIVFIITRLTDVVVGHLQKKDYSG